MRHKEIQRKEPVPPGGDVEKQGTKPLLWTVCVIPTCKYIRERMTHWS